MDNSDQPSLIGVFCHIGTPLPDYLVSNVLSTTVRFPQQNFILLTDQSRIDLESARPNLDVIQIASLPMDESIYQSNKLDLRFRDGFWKFTLERLFVILNFHTRFPNSKILHIESDVLLMPNFPFVFFERAEKAHWPNHGVNYDAASIFFSPNSQISSLIAQILLSLFSSVENPTDMKLLHLAAVQLQEFFEYLPTLPYKSESTVSTLDGVFDALGWGMYVAGIDPKNNYGVTKIRDTQTYQVGECKIDGSRYDFRLCDSTLFALSSDTKPFPIYNLHVHSKNLGLLGINWENELHRLLEKHTKKQRFVSFSPKLLLNLLQENKEKRTLIRYVRSSLNLLK